MFDSLGVKVPYSTWWRWRVSEAQGRRREAGSEGSVEQRCEPMNKNRIRGIRRRASWQLTTKPISIKDAGCKFGGCALKAVELTSGDLLRVVKSRLRLLGSSW